MTRDRRVPWLGAAGLLGAFALGVGVGTWWSIGREPDAGSGPAGVADVAKDMPAGDSGTVTMDSKSSVFDGLDLSDTQRAAIDSLLDEFSTWSDSALVREATRTQRSILDVLDTSQRERYLARIDSVGAIMRVRKIRFRTRGADP